MLIFWIISLTAAFVLGAILGGVGCAAGIIHIWKKDNKNKHN